MLGGVGGRGVKVRKEGRSEGGRLRGGPRQSHTTGLGPLVAARPSTSAAAAAASSTGQHAAVAAAPWAAAAAEGGTGPRAAEQGSGGRRESTGEQEGEADVQGTVKTQRKAGRRCAKDRWPCGARGGGGGGKEGGNRVGQGPGTRQPRRSRTCKSGCGGSGGRGIGSTPQVERAVSTNRALRLATAHSPKAAWWSASECRAEPARLVGACAGRDETRAATMDRVDGAVGAGPVGSGASRSNHAWRPVCARGSGAGLLDGGGISMAEGTDSGWEDTVKRGNRDEPAVKWWPRRHSWAVAAIRPGRAGWARKAGVVTELCSRWCGGTSPNCWTAIPWAWTGPATPGQRRLIEAPPPPPPEAP